MGLCDTFLLVDSKFSIVKEEDFDKALGQLSTIGLNLERNHPFRQIIHLLDSGSADEELTERILPLIPPECQESGVLVITPESLKQFESWLNRDLETLWESLFPPRQPGLLNWIKYKLKSEPIRKQFQQRPEQPGQVWLRDYFETLLTLLRVASQDKLVIARCLY